MRNICTTLFFGLMLLISSHFIPVNAQMSAGGVPKIPDNDQLVPEIDLTGKGHPDKSAFTAEGEKNIPLKYAVPVAVDIDPSTTGLWNTLEDGTLVWQVAIHAKEATSMSLIFDRFRLMPGQRLFIYDPSGKDMLGAFTYKNNKKSGSLALVPFPGNSLIISWEVPDGDLSGAVLHLGRVGLGFLDLPNDGSAKDGFFGSSGPCNRDINCPEGSDWQTEKNSVVRVFVNGTDLCSGVLVNNVSNDATPYVLTAGHCISDSAGAANSVFVFGYESPYCGGPDGSVTKAVSGAELKAHGGNNLDFTLVQLSQIPPFTYYPYYAGWNNALTPASASVAIHHPNGDVKKISLDYDAPTVSDYDIYDAGTFWKIGQWDIGTTEPGSSGGALFDQNHRLTGTLSGGDARCGNSVNDYFQMLHYMWDAYPEPDKQVKYWLDPDQFGFNFWNGYDPYEVSKKTCDTLTNISEGENLLLYPYGAGDDGYWSGHNINRFSKFAEVFYNSELFSMTGVYIMPGYRKFDSPTDKITVKIWDYNTSPGDIIVQKDVPMNFFQDSVWNFVDFDTIVTVNGSFFAGFEVYYDSPSGALTDQFAVMQVEARNNFGENFAYYFQNNQWATYSGTPPDYRYTSLAIQPVLCGEMPSVGVRDNQNQIQSMEIRVYPNPAERALTLIWPEPLMENVDVMIRDLSGKTVYAGVLHSSGREAIVKLPELAEGMYLISAMSTHKIFSSRFVVSKTH